MQMSKPKQQSRVPKKIIAYLFLCVTMTACRGKEDAKAPRLANGIHEGDKAPTFSIDSINGQGKVTITPGKVTLVDFWATWCQPCKKNFPKYQKIYTKYRAKGLHVVAVSVDDEESGIAEVAKFYGATFPVGWDEDHKITDLYQVSGVPILYIVGKDGTIKFIHRGDGAGDELPIEKEIEKLL
jgi:peroxiredoxin